MEARGGRLILLPPWPGSRPRVARPAPAVLTRRISYRQTDVLGADLTGPFERRVNLDEDTHLVGVELALIALALLIGGGRCAENQAGDVG